MIPRFKTLFVATKSLHFFFSQILDKQGVAKGNTCAILPNNESMGSSAWKFEAPIY
jgi:hypothetical protein